MMADLGRYERDPSICAWHLMAKMPEIAAEVERLLSVIGHDEIGELGPIRESMSRVVERVVARDEYGRFS